jgi:AcrR family transcriptional regulator
MTTKLDNLSARERILQTAGDLFYRNGYRATGINEVIEKASVAKATFYAHFPTKNALCLAYLKGTNENEVSEIMEFVNSKATPLERFFGVMEVMEPWAIRTQFRGCQFINMVPEVPDVDHPLRKEGRRFYDWAKTLVHNLGEALIESDSKTYRHLDVDELTEAYMTHLAGAIALAGVYNELWPIQSGIKAVRRLVS